MRLGMGTMIMTNERVHAGCTWTWSRVRTAYNNLATHQQRRPSWRSPYCRRLLTTGPTPAAHHYLAPAVRRALPGFSPVARQLPAGRHCC